MLFRSKTILLSYPSHLQLQALRTAQTLRETAIVKLSVDETLNEITQKEEM